MGRSSEHNGGGVSPPSAGELASLLLSGLVSEVSAAFVALPPSELGRGVDIALRILGETLGCDRCFVRLFSADKKRLLRTFAWTRDAGVAMPPETLNSDELPHFFARILRGHDWIFDPQESVDPSWQGELRKLEVWGIRSLVCMPLRTGRTVSGVVGFVSTQRARPWSRDVLSSMRLTVELIACALERKRQDEELGMRQEFDALVARVSRGFVTAHKGSLDEVVPRALADVGQTLGFERAIIFRHEATGSCSYVWHEWRLPEVASVRPGLERLNRRDYGYYPPGIKQGEGVILDIENLPPAAALYGRRGREHNVRTLALAPLWNGGTDFGVLMLHHSKWREWPADLRRQLTLLGELFAGIITRIEAEQARERAYRELEALKAQIERERDYLREEIRSEQLAGEILGDSPAMRGVMNAIAKVAATQATVLIRGESGVGKELIARAIHERSPRREGPLVKVNCASIPRELFESEFFGHARGSFTGAHKDRAGRFELADRGTLLLDEVGDIPLDLQAKLLRVLQEGEYERVGDERTRRANVRVIAATNRELEDDIAEGRFRRDLYYRLSAFPIVVPPLREREDDVVTLARHFLSLYGRAAGKRGLSLLPEHLEALRSYDWPGNVRELQHVIERAVILSSDTQLRLELALSRLSRKRRVAPSRPERPLPAEMAVPMPVLDFKRLERDNILAALEMTRWRVAGAGGAAKLLGLAPSTLRDRMRALGIAR
jgi:transcriptional regulator with GAF, ATPase, and Fis domain